eukprot:3941185-Rhodomonas_salina.6
MMSATGTGAAASTVGGKPATLRRKPLARSAAPSSESPESRCRSAVREMRQPKRPQRTGSAGLRPPPQTQCLPRRGPPLSSPGSSAPPHC